MAYVPLILAAVGALQQGAAQRTASLQNAEIAGNERKIAVDQSNVQEGMVRRSSREQLGKEVAAFGAAGVGYGGSSEKALDQSAINQEMDALNTRYRGSIVGYGYGVKQGFDRYNAGVEGAQGGLLAGAALIRGLGSKYSFAPASAATQAGLEAPG